jgi:hypothetical protein
VNDARPPLPAAPPAKAATPWQAPAFLWEQPFRALLQASPINPVPCEFPNRDGSCP